jgi:hypothetical protein
MRPNMVEAGLTFGGLDRLGDGFHIDAFPNCNFVFVDGSCFPPALPKLVRRV